MLALVVDSSADLTRAEASQLNAFVAPMTYLLDGERKTEGFMGENGPFAAELVEGRITEGKGVATSTFVPLFEKLTAEGADVLCITTSAKFSSTYRNAVAAADQVRSGIRRAAGCTSREANSAAAERGAAVARIAVLDSQSAICGVESLARIARALEAKGAGFDEIFAALEEARTDQGIVFTVPSVEALRRTGRIALIPLSVRTMLNRHPVLTVRDGALVHVKTSRGARGLARDMVANVPANGTRDLTLTCFGGGGVIATELLRATREAFPQVNVRVKEGGPVLASILGSGAVSLAWGPATS